MAVALDGKLWIATEDAGIAIFDRSNNSFKHLRASGTDGNSLTTNNIHALYMDGDFCWAGHFNGGLSKIDVYNFKVKNYHTTISPTSLSNNFVFSIFPLSKDSLLVGTIVGIDVFDKKTETFSRFRQNELIDCNICDMFEAPDHKIWICTYNKGIFVLDRENKGLMTHYEKGDYGRLPSNAVISFCVDSKQRIWVGTRGEGLCRFDPENGVFISYADSKLLNDKVVYGILENDEGEFWLSTNKGLSTNVLLGSNKAKDTFQRVEYSVPFAVNYVLTDFLQVSLRYNMGISNIAKNDYPDQRLKNNWFGISFMIIKP